MAILDAKLLLSDAQSVSGASAVVSTNVIDLTGGLLKNAWGAAKTPDPGEAGVLEFNCSVNVAMVGAGITCTVTLVTKAADASIGSAGTTIATLQAFPAATAAGVKRSVKIPTGAVQRYLGCIYTPSGSLTSSKFDAWIGLDHSTA